MAKLRLGPIVDEKPVRLTAELPAAVYRDLLAYADALGHETGQAVEATHLVGPMLARFMATDRAFAKVQKSRVTGPVTTAVDLSGALPREDAPQQESA